MAGDNMTRTEELIGAALRHQATRAPSAERMLAELDGVATVRKARPRRWLAPVASFAAVAAVLAVVVLSGGHRADEAIRPPGALIGWTLTAPPAGYTECERTFVSYGRITSRSYCTGPAMSVLGQADSRGPYVSLLVTPSSALASALYRGQAAFGDGPLLRVHGNPGAYHPADNGRGAKIEWAPNRNTLLLLSTQGLMPSKAQLLRLAESVHRDDRSTIGQDMRFGYLPPGMNDLDLSLASAGINGWQAFATVSRDPGHSISAYLTPNRPSLPNGVPMTVRGREGSYIAARKNRAKAGLSPSPADKYVTVQLDSGQWLTVVADSVDDGFGRAVPSAITAQQLARVSDGIRFSPPDTSWLR